VGVEFGRGEALVELEVDAAGRGVEAELAPGAVVVFPAAMGVGEEVVGQLLDDILQRQLRISTSGSSQVSAAYSISVAGKSTAVSPDQAPMLSIWPLSPAPSKVTVTWVMPAAMRPSKRRSLLPGRSASIRAARSACAAKICAMSTVEGAIGGARVGSVRVIGCLR
jgi:hypothetical protein